MDIQRNGTRPSQKGPEQYFSGSSVRVDMLFDAQAPARASGALVTFEPGARTAWHSHPCGQVLIVTSGKGIVQQWGEEPQVINSGDVVWIAPGEKHWHGAGPNTATSHIAIKEAIDGLAATWMEQVSDGEYGN